MSADLADELRSTATVTLVEGENALERVAALLPAAPVPPAGSSAHAWCGLDRCGRYHLVKALGEAFQPSPLLLAEDSSSITLRLFGYVLGSSWFRGFAVPEVVNPCQVSVALLSPFSLSGLQPSLP
jgi:hypothetical protein